jgi:hypothetical protein
MGWWAQMKMKRAHPISAEKDDVAQTIESNWAQWI